MSSETNSKSVSEYIAGNNAHISEQPNGSMAIGVTSEDAAAALLVVLKNADAASAHRDYVSKGDISLPAVVVSVEDAERLNIIPTSEKSYAQAESQPTGSHAVSVEDQEAQRKAGTGRCD